MSELENGAEGARRAYSATDPEWKEAADRAMAKVVVNKARFCADDVWATGLPKPQEARALGAVIMRWARKGYIERTEDFKRSEQEGCHGMDVRIWRSLRYTEAS